MSFTRTNVSLFPEQRRKIYTIDEETGQSFALSCRNGIDLEYARLLKLGKVPPIPFNLPTPQSKPKKKNQKHAHPKTK